MSGHDEPDFALQIEDMARPADPRDLIITDHGRIKSNERAKRCIHGNGLSGAWIDGHQIAGAYCAACEFELILLERKPSERP